MGLIRLALIALCVWLLYRVLRGYLASRTASGPTGARRRGERQGRPPAIEELVQDPQCQTYLPKGEAVRARVGGQELFFCSEKCRDAYLLARGVKK